MAEGMSQQRQEWIRYLLQRAYPRKRDGTRGLGNKEFYAELCEQPDNVLKSLFDSALREELARKNEKKSFA